MVATELTQRRHTWHPTLSAGAVIGLTALGVGLALIDPGLAGSTRPHPTLTGSLGDAAGILQNNARVLAAPFLLVVLDFPHGAYVPVSGGGDRLLLHGYSRLYAVEQRR